MNWIEFILLALALSPIVLAFLIVMFCIGYFGAGGNWKHLRKLVKG